MNDEKKKFAAIMMTGRDMWASVHEMFMLVLEDSLLTDTKSRAALWSGFLAGLMGSMINDIGPET